MTVVENKKILSVRRKEFYTEVHKLHDTGYSILKISKTLKYSRTTVYKYLNGDFLSICSIDLTGNTDNYRDYIVKALTKGDCRSNIYRELQKRGLSCSRPTAYDYMNRIAAVYDIEISRNHNCTPM